MAAGLLLRQEVATDGPVTQIHEQLLPYVRQQALEVPQLLGCSTIEDRAVRFLFQPKPKSNGLGAMQTNGCLVIPRDVLSPVVLLFKA